MALKLYSSKSMAQGKRLRQQNQSQQHGQQPETALFAALAGFHLDAQAQEVAFMIAVQRGMGQARQLRQDAGPVRRLGLECIHQPAPADLLRHPAFQVRLGGLPQVEIGVELAPQALDIEQGLLQQHQLRLDLHVEAARGLEQPQQHASEGDFLERAVESRFAHRANRRFEFVHPGILRRPAGLDMRLRHAFVIAAEEGEKILRQVVAIHIGKRAHDAEIERDIAPVGRHQDVAGMHVGMEKTVAEHLGEENFHPGAGQLGNIRPPARAACRPG